MAQLLARSLATLRSQTKSATQILQEKTTAKVLEGCTVQAAHLTSYHGEKAPRNKPFPYKTKPFRYWHIPFDRVDRRLDDNTKIIVVDGNLASGKTELGKKIAKEFDLLYVPDVTDNDMYTIKETNFDSREYDEQLPPKARSCDFERFYSQKGSKQVLKNAARMQYHLYRHKLIQYAQVVMAHVLNTGQGVVMNRGMWSDMVWAQTMWKHGYMSGPALKEYQYQFDVSSVYMWHPHVVIYLDMPVGRVKENITQRNVPWEVNSPVLDCDFLQTLNDSYKNTYIPYIKRWSEVLVYNLEETPELDFEVLVEDLESLDLDNPTLEYPKRFSEWKDVHNRDYNEQRRLCSIDNIVRLNNIFAFRRPYGDPVLVVDGDDAIAYENLVLEDPRKKFHPNFQPGNKSIYFRL